MGSHASCDHECAVCCSLPSTITSDRRTDTDMSHRKTDEPIATPATTSLLVLDRDTLEGGGPDEIRQRNFLIFFFSNANSYPSKIAVTKQ